MAGRILTPDELKAACQTYAKSHGLEMSQGENGSIALMPGDIVISLKDGKMQCGDPDIALSIMECLPEVTRGANLAEPRPAKTNNMPMPARNGSNGAMMRSGMQVRDIQVAELTFDDIKTYICPTANDQEIMIFLKLCQARNLNPFLRESYLIKYDQTKPAQMVVGKDKFCKTAEEHPQFDGFRAGIIVGKGDEILEREGTFFRKGEELLGGWAEVSRKDRKIPFKQTVSLSEFNKGMANWKTMPATMIRKCALVQALRECFASDLAGCYDRSEMGLDPENEISEA